MNSEKQASAKSDWRPPTRLIFGSPVHVLAFGFGAGLSPRAPGTIGTLVGLPFWFLLSTLPPLTYVAALAAMLVAGCWICGESARRLGVQDFGGIVFDEIVGFLIACLPLLPAFGLEQDLEIFGLIAAFAAFRLFDIWKPWPIGWLDRRIHGGVGIMLDDVVAGIFAALLLALGLVLTRG